MEAIPFTGEQLTLAGLLGVTVMSILMGWILPRWVYLELKERFKEERDAKDKALEANKILGEALLEALKIKEKDPVAERALRERAGI